MYFCCTIRKKKTDFRFGLYSKKYIASIKTGPFFDITLKENNTKLIVNYAKCYYESVTPKDYYITGRANPIFCAVGLHLISI